jgi:hypothetical protein
LRQILVYQTWLALSSGGLRQVASFRPRETSTVGGQGNDADLDFTDFARYLLEDPDTRVIAGFVEGFKQADKFLEVAKLAAERGKPIVLIKIGRSELGARAARSHTAALTGADARYDAIFAQYGVIRVQDYDELLETAHLLAHTPKPGVPGIAVVSHSVKCWSGLSVEKSLIDAANRREMHALAARRDVSKVTMSAPARTLFSELRKGVLSLDSEILELAETRSVSYHCRHFF